MSKSPTSEFKSSAGIVMLRAPAGSFTMGSPESEDGHQVWERQREVTFASDFYLGKTPVTQAQYEAVTGTNPTDHEKIGDAPVDTVSPAQAADYCQKLTELDRAAGVLADGWEYRLPTEAEWEYACRAGTSDATYGPLDSIAWHFGNADQRPHPVGAKAPNPWGFHDMLGNVWEMCQDWFRVKGKLPAGRGGSYFNTRKCCRAAARGYAWRIRYCGFRLLAARAGSFELSPPIDDFQAQTGPPSIYDAIDANDFDLALRIVTADPLAVESPDAIPPPLECCGDADKPEWVEWLLDHGADIERRNQDYGSTPLTCAVIRRQKRIIRTLMKRGADATGAMDCAQRGLAGAYEDDPSLDREGYREIIELLRELGIGSGQ
jgi:Sulfatase-modifying factor enzyme 1/Ankyrin repeats (many copies)